MHCCTGGPPAAVAFELLPAAQPLRDSGGARAARPALAKLRGGNTQFQASGRPAAAAAAQRASQQDGVQISHDDPTFSARATANSIYKAAAGITGEHSEQALYGITCLPLCTLWRYLLSALRSEPKLFSVADELW